tara:strand:- start:424 stop:687 length:264 start_codon:yes stop_codon:yes gene_type:complete
MYILTLKNRPDGVYSIITDDGEQVIPIFEEETDIERYYYMMEADDDNPPLQIVEIEREMIIDACEDRYHKYAIITKDDFLIPPKDLE